MQETQTYIDRSHAYLVKAREELAAGDLEQASEKAWGAAALMVKAVAEQRQLPHVSHNNLWAIVQDLGTETRDRELVRSFHIANGLHKNFYEDRLNADTLEADISDIERFVEKVERLGLRRAV